MKVGARLDTISHATVSESSVKLTHAHFQAGKFVLRVTDLRQIEFCPVKAKTVVEKATIQGDSAAEFARTIFRVRATGCSSCRSAISP